MRLVSLFGILVEFIRVYYEMTRTAAAMISADEHKLSKLKSLAGGEGFLSRSIYSNFNLLKRLISLCNGDDTDVSFV